MEPISNELARELFECLMNRIYSHDEFFRVGDMAARERAAVDAYLDRTATDDDAEEESE
jgi:hypothetical protein